MKCLFTGKTLKLTLIVPESCTVQSSHYVNIILLALLSLCVPPVQNVFVHTKTTTTELTVLFCSTQSPVACVCVCALPVISTITVALAFRGSTSASLASI